MSEGYKGKSGSRQSRRRSIVIRTPEVLRHRPSHNDYRSRAKRENVQTLQNSVRVKSSNSKSNKWYATGYPALRIADRKLRERQEEQKMKDNNRLTRKTRSYSRGKSVYANNEDSRVPYHRSRSLDITQMSLSTFDPEVSRKDTIRLTYTGSTSRPNSTLSSRGSRRGSLSSRRGSGIVQKKVGSVVPHMRRSYTFDDLQTRIYQQIHKTYGEPDADLKNKQFFLTLAQMQSDHYRMKKMKLNESDRNFLEKMFEEMKYIQKETGKILQNSGKRYSTQFEQPSPVNDKLRSLPKGNQHETFLKRVPRQKEKLKLKPLRNPGVHRKRETGYRYANSYDQYENYKRRDLNKSSSHYQRAKVPDNPSDMLLFLQEAERLLTAYSTGLLEDSTKGYDRESYTNLARSQTDKQTKLKQQQQHNHHQQQQRQQQQQRIIQHQSFDKTREKQSSGQKNPLNQLSTQTNVGHKPAPPVYKRPEAFYDARKHMNFYSRANLVSHRLNETKSTSSLETKQSFTTFAT